MKDMTPCQILKGLMLTGATLPLACFVLAVLLLQRRS